MAISLMMDNSVTWVECEVCGRDFLIPEWVTTCVYSNGDEIAYICEYCPPPVGVEVHWVLPEYNRNTEQLLLFEVGGKL